MKNTIRRWLGIEKMKEDIYKISISNNDLRKLIGQALEGALEGKPDDGYYYTWGLTPNFSNTLNRALAAAAKETSINTVKSEIEKESFIDSIVKRIMDKQLK